MNNEEMLNLENIQDVDELKEELKTQPTIEIKQYRNFLFIGNIVYRTGFGFAVLFIVIMGIAFWAFFETGITLILFIGLIIHIVLFQLLLYLFRKNVSSMKKERVEMRKMLSILNQELQSRKNKKRI
ncbi:MAG: hypothetical protein WHW07_10640 [Bacteroidales bacterium]